jgi:hypothetical protein
MELEQTIHPVYTDEAPPLYFIAPNDGTRAYCLGERWELAAIRDKLTAILERDEHDGVLTESAERLGDWLTVKQAAKMTDLTERSIRRACRLGTIEGAKAAPWRMSRVAFRRWRHDEKAHRPGRK